MKKTVQIAALLVMVLAIIFAFYIASSNRQEDNLNPGYIIPTSRAPSEQPFRPVPTGETDSRWDKYRPHGTTTPQFEFQNP